MVPTDAFATGFAGAAQLVRVERHVWEGAGGRARADDHRRLRRHQPRRGGGEATPAQLLAALREHWAAIENGQHHRRDRTYREDQSPVRDPNATPCYAALRALAIFLCVQHKRAQRRPQDYHLPDFLREARAQPTKTIRWFTHRYRSP